MAIMFGPRKTGASRICLRQTKAIVMIEETTPTYSSARGFENEPKYIYVTKEGIENKLCFDWKGRLL